MRIIARAGEVRGIVKRANWIDLIRAIHGAKTVSACSGERVTLFVVDKGGEKSVLAYENGRRIEA